MTTDLISSMVTESTNLIPRLSDQFKFVLAPGNVIVAIHPTSPVLYLDESRMVWVELKTDIRMVAKNART